MHERAWACRGSLSCGYRRNNFEVRKCQVCGRGWQRRPRRSQPITSSSSGFHSQHEWAQDASRPMTASGSGPHIKQRCNRPGCGILHQGVEIMRWISMLHYGKRGPAKATGMGRWRAATSSAGAENEQGEAGDVVLAPSLGQIREAWKAVEPASGAGHPVTNVIKV